MYIFIYVRVHVHINVLILKSNVMLYYQYFKQKRK